jgi:hypothetical protein
VMSQPTCKSELPNPQKALTKLTKGVVRGAFVSFVSGFLHPQIAKTDVLPPSRPTVSLTPQFFEDRQPRGRTRDVDPSPCERSYPATRLVNARPRYRQMPEQLGLA